MPEAEPDALVERTRRDGPPAFADFTGLDPDEGRAASVATFDDLGEPGTATSVRPDLLGREDADGDTHDHDTQDMASFGGPDEAFADETFVDQTSADGAGKSGGPVGVRTASLDDLSGSGDDEDDQSGGDGAAGVRVASFDGRRPRSGRSPRSGSDRSRATARRTSTTRGAASGRGVSDGPVPDGRVSDGAVAGVRAPDDAAAEPDGGESGRSGRSARSGGSGFGGRGGGRTKRDGGSSRGGRGGGGLSFSPQDDEARAKEVCLRLLTDRARTVQELSQALRRKEIPDEVAQKVLERFDEVGLVDDEAFAGQWVRSRHKQRGLGKRAIAAELHRKGVAKEIADEALTEIDAESEEARARELVDRKLRTVPIGTKEQRVTAARRLVGMLARKGYGGNIAYRVVKEAIAEHGADPDELGEGPVDD
ncbi:regulatory protein [Pseudonocardia sediminis]|uniref:Regulatory protein RecX n=1 Tax=Pseudonocardia sediminis TaxID=1397368 RepID=A0A4Q7USI6_PSEST|nr:regulatory protein [Pseudonocardia sediminis]